MADGTEPDTAAGTANERSEQDSKMLSFVELAASDTAADRSAAVGNAPKMVVVLLFMKDPIKTENGAGRRE